MFMKFRGIRDPLPPVHSPTREDAPEPYGCSTRTYKNTNCLLSSSGIGTWHGAVTVSRRLFRGTTYIFRFQRTTEYMTFKRARLFQRYLFYQLICHCESRGRNHEDRFYRSNFLGSRCVQSFVTISSGGPIRATA